jgi:hypothetical protein
MAFQRLGTAHGPLRPSAGGVGLLIEPGLSMRIALGNVCLWPRWLRLAVQRYWGFGAVAGRNLLGTVDAPGHTLAPLAGHRVRR